MALPKWLCWRHFLAICLSKFKEEVCEFPQVRILLQKADRSKICCIKSYFPKFFWFHSFSVLRSSRPEVLCKKGVLKNFEKSRGKHLCQSLFFNNVASLRQKRLCRKCFPVNFAKFSRTPFFIEHLRWLLLYSGDLGICKELLLSQELPFLCNTGPNFWPISIHWSFSVPPWKLQQTSGFLIFSGGIWRDQWYEMTLYSIKLF